MPTTVTSTIAPPLPHETTVRFVCGMPGFEERHAYTLVGIEGVPVYWLRCADEPGINLPVAEAFHVDPAYSVALSNADAAALDLEQSDDAFVLVVLTLRRDGAVTANLFAPIVINRRSWRAKQVILDGSNYSLQQPVEGFE
jgi:flagellar assembly factor FliW